MPGVIPRVDPDAVSSSPFKRSLFAFALTKAGTWYSSQLGARVDPWLLRATRGRVDHAFGQIPIVLLTVRGARSGVERTVPLLYFSDGDDVILVASSYGRPEVPRVVLQPQGQPRGDPRGQASHRSVCGARGHRRGARPPVRTGDEGLPRLHRLRTAHRGHPPHPGDAPLTGLTPTTSAAYRHASRGRGSRRRLPAGVTPRRAR